MSSLVIKLASGVDLQIQRTDTGRVYLHFWATVGRDGGKPKIVCSVYPKPSDLRVYNHDGYHTLHTDEALFDIPAGDVAPVCTFLGIEAQSP